MNSRQKQQVHRFLIPRADITTQISLQTTSEPREWGSATGLSVIIENVPSG